MSYCRFSDGDVYVFKSVAGGWECCVCCLGEVQEGCIFPPSVTLHTIGDVRAHLQEHADAGHDVPDYAIANIDAEIAEHGADWDGES